MLQSKTCSQRTPESPFSESTLRAENRIQDDPEILTKVGYMGDVPRIPTELLVECASSSFTLVLLFPTTIYQYQSNLNSALGKMNSHLFLRYSNRAKLAIDIREAIWVNVPNKVLDKTLLLSKAEALMSIAGSELCDPMETVLMLGYSNLLTKQQMPGFRNKGTFTRAKDVYVSSDGAGIGVFGCEDFDNRRLCKIGLAPRFPHSQLAW
jgi:hypothetical protein